MQFCVKEPRTFILNGHGRYINSGIVITVDMKRRILLDVHEQGNNFDAIKL